MKKLISTMLLALASTASFANCEIDFFTDSDLNTMITDKAFIIDEEYYNSLCTQLQKNKAGIYFDYTNYVSPQHTTTYVSLRLYDINKSRGLITLDKYSTMSYNDKKDRDDNNDLYETSMITLSLLATNQEILDKMFSQLNQMRSDKIK
ncbi:hypothetical protein [Acinetobacter zhairhuonensis]|uniref:hypothetical protein n=1 Tax=Acinetobacter sp. A7.4 TaxID=2919921 RepID=UPI001F4FC4EA|nr:hypothetical protein [Acinetobacter sp. A7.4]MCJ8163135.1 hypothetical protein [Acinetobacter sp. A7.4]